MDKCVKHSRKNSPTVVRWYPDNTPCPWCAEVRELKAELRGWLNLPYAEALDAHDSSTRALLGELL